MRLNKSWMVGVVMMLLPWMVQGQEIADRQVDEFNKLRVFGKMKVRLVPGNEPNVHIEARNISLEKVKTSLKDGELRVKISRLFKDHEVYVEITHGELESVEALADAEIVFDKPVVTRQFTIQSTMGSIVELAIDASYLEMKAYQGGQVQIKGSTDHLEAYVNTGGILSGTDLVCQRADIRMNTGGKGELTIREQLKARVNTGADFSYYGTPSDTDVSTSLGGSISGWDQD